MKKRIGYILLLLILLFLYVWTNKKMTLYALLFFGAVLLCSSIINLWTARKIKVSYEFVQNEKAGSNHIVVVVENKSIFPSNHIENIIKCENIVFGTKDVKKICLSVAGKSKEKFLLPIASKYCGRVDLDVLKCMVYDWMDFSYKSIKVEKEGCYYAYPKTNYQAVDQIKDGISEGEEVTYKHVVGNDISEILQIREYRRGDTIKNIHWKLSAKSGKLLVKEPDCPNDNSIMLLFDYDKKEERDINNKILTAVSNISSEMMKEHKGHTVYRMDTGEERMVERAVEEPEEFDVMQQELLETEAKTTPKTVADEIMDSNIHRRFARIIYVCSANMYGDSGIEDLENCTVVRI